MMATLGNEPNYLRIIECQQEIKSVEFIANCVKPAILSFIVLSQSHVHCRDRQKKRFEYYLKSHKNTVN